MAKEKRTKPNWFIITIGLLIFLAIYTILTHMCMNPFDIRHLFPKYYDYVSFSAPAWISDDELVFIKVVVHYEERPPFMSDNWIWRSDHDAHLCTIKIDGTDKREIVRVEDGEQLDYCPANKKVAYVYKRFIEAAYGRWDYEIWTVNIDGTDKRRIAVLDRLPSTLWSPALSWSPEGDKIVYETPTKIKASSGEDYRGGNIWIMNADGGNKHNLSIDNLDRRPVWSPDGTKIAFYREYFWYDKIEKGKDEPRPDEIWIMNPDGTERKMVKKEEFGLLEWAPDSSLLSTGTSIINLDGKLIKKLKSTFVVREKWSPDGKRFAGDFVSGMQKNGICVVDMDGMNPKELLVGHEINYGRRIVGTFRFKKSGVW